MILDTIVPLEQLPLDVREKFEAARDALAAYYAMGPSEPKIGPGATLPPEKPEVPAETATP